MNRSQQRWHKKQRETCLSDFSSSGWNPINVTFKDEFGDEVVICGEPFAANLSDEDVYEFVLFWISSIYLVQVIMSFLCLPKTL